MEKLIGYSRKDFPYKDLTKVSDLLFYEGPILSHFRDNDGNNYLFHWVDYDSQFNRWIVFKITEEQLYNYLRSVTNLRDVLMEQSREFVTVVDIDKNLSYKNISLIELKDLNKTYIPDANSYFTLQPEAVYSDFLSKFEVNDYVYHLRQDAIYFVLKPSDLKFGHTLGIDEASSFLKNIKTSYLNYIDFDFLRAFKEKYFSVDQLGKIVKTLKEELNFRIVDLGFSSFKVGLGSDFLAKENMSKDITEWKNGILTKFKENVVEVDYNSDDVAAKIAQEYPEEVRERIFEPFIKVVNNENYGVSVSSFKNRKPRVLKRIKKSTEDIIVPPSIIEKTKDSQVKTFLNVIIEHVKGEDFSKLSMKELQQGMLFSQEITEAPIKFEGIESQEYLFELKKPIETLLSINEGIYTLASDTLKLKLKGNTREQVITNFTVAFNGLYEKYRDNQLNADLAQALGGYLGRVTKKTI